VGLLVGFTQVELFRSAAWKASKLIREKLQASEFGAAKTVTRR